MGTWECPQCKRGWRTSINGLVEARDLVGKFKVKENQNEEES